MKLGTLDEVLSGRIYTCQQYSMSYGIGLYDWSSVSHGLRGTNLSGSDPSISLVRRLSGVNEGLRHFVSRSTCHDKHKPSAISQWIFGAIFFMPFTENMEQGSKPKKRIITNARREQNKAAQRAWSKCSTTSLTAQANFSLKDKDKDKIVPV